MNIADMNLFDENIERALLSSILYDNQAFSEVYDILSPNDFYMPGHADIYEAMRKCSLNNDPIDLAFVKKHLGDNFNESVFDSIFETNPITDIIKYAKEIKDLSIRRALNKISATFIPSKIQENKPVFDIVDDINAQIYDLIDNANTGVIKDSSVIIAETLEEYSKILERGDGLIGIDTGYSELNKKTKGFKGGDLIVIAARSGMGKTTFALNLVERILFKQNNGVVFFSLEMDAKQLMFRLLSSITSLKLQDIMSASLNDDQLSRLSDACDVMKQKKFFVYDNRGISLHQVRSQMQKLKHSHPEIQLCVIDYIGLMDVSANYKERHLQIAEISRGLKLLARELNIPIIVLAQLNRGVESRSNHRPMLSDLRESGAIEQDADLILFVYRSDFYKEMESKEAIAKAKADGVKPPEAFVAKTIEEAEIIIGKNRNGPTGQLKFMFNKETSHFSDPEVENFSSPVSVIEHKDE